MKPTPSSLWWVQPSVHNHVKSTAGGPGIVVTFITLSSGQPKCEKHLHGLSQPALVRKEIFVAIQNGRSNGPFWFKGLLVRSH